MHGVLNVISPLIEENLRRSESEAITTKTYVLGAKAQYKPDSLASCHEWRIRWRVCKKEDSGYDQQKLSVKNFYSLKDIDSFDSYLTMNSNQETAGYIKGFNSYKDRQSRRENLNPEAFRDAQSLRLSSKIEGNSHVVTNGRLLLFRKSKMNFLQHYLPGQPQESNGQYSNGIQTNLIVDKENMDIALGIDLERAKMYVVEVQENILGTANNVRFQGNIMILRLIVNNTALYANLNQKIQLDNYRCVG